jgi:GGDEF domain-containing protein
MFLLYEVTRALSGRLTLSEISEVLANQLRRLVPATTCVLFIYDHQSDELRTAHASGDHSAHFTDIRIGMGQRLSGWVAANRQTILNSDPMLDLGEIARVLRPALRSCLSTALLFENDLVGVLTVYSTHREVFNEDHRRVIEIMARQLSPTVNRAIVAQDEADKLRLRLAGLPGRQHFDRFAPSELSALDGFPCSVLLVDLQKVLGSEGEPRPNAEQLFGALAERARAALSGSDLIFRFDFDRLVILLPHADRRTADAVAQSLAVTIAESLESAERSLGETVRIGRATAPEDARVLSDLVAVAEARLVPSQSEGQQLIH